MVAARLAAAIVAGRKSSALQLRHSARCVTFCGDRSPPARRCGAAMAADGEAGVAWDWVQIARGVVAIADPMSVVTNVRLVGDEGEVLTAHRGRCFLNELVRALPWQSEVRARCAGATQ
jgi:hypothetical protein